MHTHLVRLVVAAVVQRLATMPHIAPSISNTSGTVPDFGPALQQRRYASGVVAVDDSSKGCSCQLHAVKRLPLSLQLHVRMRRHALALDGADASKLRGPVRVCAQLLSCL